MGFRNLQEKLEKILFCLQDEESKTIMIQYKTRREAETAMLKSNQFTERSLQLTWHTISLGDSTGNLNYRIVMIFVRGCSQTALTRFWLFLTTYPPPLTFSTL